jgi:hypothetical protein
VVKVYNEEMRSIEVEFNFFTGPVFCPECGWKFRSSILKRDPDGQLRGACPICSTRMKV